MSRWFLTDEQVVERIRRWQRYRRPVGALCAVLGLFLCVLVLYWGYKMKVRVESTLNGLQSVMIPTTQQVAQSMEETRFTSAFVLGMWMAGCLASAVWLLMSGILCLMVANRKDKLLLKCWYERASTIPSDGVAAEGARSGGEKGESAVSGGGAVK